MTDDCFIRILRLDRRTLSMHIEPDGSVLVKAPLRMSDPFIKKFIAEHQDWISKHRKKILSGPQKMEHQYIDGEKFLFLGMPHTLSVGTYKTINRVSSTIQFPNHLHFRIRKELTDWYRKQAASIIIEQVATHAKAMHVTHREISFADTKSKWGSCAPDNRLQFNWRLIMAPLIIVRYVVIHELAHTVEKNHSRAFWHIVETHNPSYRQQRKWLKTNGHTLVI